MLDKTKTIKQRAINVYLPTEDMVEAWKERAKERKMSLSKFVVATVEATVDTLGADAYRKERDVRKELEDVRKENDDLKEDLRQSKLYGARLESDLRTARLELAEKITKPKANGKRIHGGKLVKALTERRVVTNEELLERLGIGFMDVKSIEAVKAQLEVLAEYELIEYSGNSWRWIHRIPE